MAISAKDVKKLREVTGAGMMDCKKALTEAEGDFEAAIDFLRKRGQKISAKRADKEASEGAVFTKTFNDGKEGVIIALNCETDFVAKNEEFLELGNLILNAAVDNKPAGVDALKAIEADGQAINDRLTSMIGKIGEKIEISEYELLEAEKVVPYIHAGSKLGVLVALENVGSANADEVGRDVGMQIAAMNPVSVSKEDVPEDVVNREFELGKQKAKEEGKPEQILEKIAQGYVTKFYKENTLLNQVFVKDSKATVQDYLNSANKGMTVRTFKRISLGG